MAHDSVFGKDQLAVELRWFASQLPIGWSERFDDKKRSAIRERLTDDLHRLREKVNSLRPSLSTDETRELNQILSDAAGLVRMKSDQRERASEMSDRFRNLSGRIEFSTGTSAAEDRPDDDQREPEKPNGNEPKTVDGDKLESYPVTNEQLSDLTFMDEQTIRNWGSKHKDRPKPIATPKSGHVYSYREQRDWLVKHGCPSDRLPEDYLAAMNLIRTNCPPGN